MTAGPATPLPPAYGELFARHAEIGALEECSAILSWDQSVTMPPAGAVARGEQFAALSAATHRLAADPAIGTLLDRAEADEVRSLPAEHAANLMLMRRLHTRRVALPERLVADLARASTACETTWRGARANSDFAAILPALSELVGLTREAAARLADATGLAPYDALMDGFQPGMRTDRIAPLFDELERFLPPLIAARLAAQARATPPLQPRGPFPIAVQRQLARRLAEVVGVDFNAARLDESAHPFSGGTPDDVRITVRYREDDFAQALLAVVHESGHALYQRNLPPLLRRQPAGDAAGMAVHESQSLTVEMQACRGDDFLGWLAPVLADAFGADPAFDAANLVKLWREVRRGFIRVEADELTYPLHVILRFRLETALIAGELEPAGLPRAWNAGFAALFGTPPPDDARGCLQDIHWYTGSFGYFPAYTLGAIAAAQLFQAATVSDPAIAAGLARGDFRPLEAWNRTHVHAHGAMLDLDGVIRAATGRGLEIAPFRQHLLCRYGET